jgi:hypothetical protein|tara:strand:+ start:797 stop:1297 length:501 start_codon:yes stop_codon:yes gene_type:complete
MAEKTYDKIEQRVTRAIPEWKEWPRRLRRIYASLEDWGATEAAVQDMIEQWGWDLAVIKGLIKKSPTFIEAIEEYRTDGDYPKKKGWVKNIRTSELKAVYMREGELTSFASLDENPKATSFHGAVVAANGMLDLAEPYADRDDLSYPSDAPQKPSDGSGLTSFEDE